MALGATAQNVVWMMLRRGIQIVAVGLLIGLVGAAASARLLRTMLFQVRPNDPLVYLAVAVLLGLVALVASYVPARRASKIDPLVALRQE
jgi:ABC-type antimicrobial peptide transport system permease subunit